MNDHRIDGISPLEGQRHLRIEGNAHRKHIINDKIRYIGKETNNLDEVNLFGVQDDSVMAYTRDSEIAKSKEFQDWILSLKPKDVKDEGISERGLERTQIKIRTGKKLNPKTKTVKLLLDMYRKEVLHEN